jgi:Ser/Thr protein kinase RdoA (MazF antagonist)
MPTDTIPLQELLGHMERAVQSSLHLWPMPTNAVARLINVSENATFLVEGTNYRSVLRVHRPGYHSRKGIQQELAWSTALARDGMVITPAPVAGIDSELVQVLQSPGLAERHFMVMFEFAEGRQPDPGDDLTKPFGRLGAIAAQTHEHSRAWTHPQPLERLTWDAEAVFGRSPTWGNWRDAPNVTSEIRNVLDKTEALIARRLDAFGKGRDRYGLIHADMRLANLLIEGERTCLIDFDDCGLGWFLYDFAAGISFMEDHPQVPALREAWIEGYRSVRSLAVSEEREIDTFVMMRRMALLAWIGSHIEAPEPRAMAPHFAMGTAQLAIRYLDNFSES